MKLSEIFNRAAKSLNHYSCFAISAVVEEAYGYNTDLANKWSVKAHEFYRNIACCSPQGEYSLRNNSFKMPYWWSESRIDPEDREMRIEMLELAMLSAERMEAHDGKA